MSNILFVCYRQGHRGEFLSHKISQHSIFRSLEAKVVGNRTVILNEFFNKDFLKTKYPKILNRSIKENIVVPSHYFYEDLFLDFPNAVYIAIDIAKDLDSFNQFLYKRFWEYSTKNQLELIGEVVDKFHHYNISTNEEKDNELEKIIHDVLRIKNITFGDIACMVQQIEPTEENKRKLFKKRKIMGNLSPLSKEKSLVIPYEEVETFPIDTIVDYFKKCNGSL